MTGGAEPVFRSAIDRWYKAATAISALGPALLLVFLFFAGAAPLLPLLAMAPFTFIAFGIALWILKTTRYVLGQEALRIQSGPFRWEIPYRTIHRVAPADDVISSPALSLRRLEILYAHGKRILISPEREHDFLGLLRARLPAASVIEPHGTRPRPPAA